MATQTQTQMLARLDLWLDDADNFAFTAAIKSEGYSTIVNNDPYAWTVVVDKTVTTVANQAEYTLATAYDDILELRIDILGDGYGHFIDPSAYEYVNGVLIFDPFYKGLISGKTLIIRAKQHLQSTDSIPDMLQAYILHLATAHLQGILMSRKTGRFLRNDTTMAEIVQSKREHERLAQELRRELGNRRDIRI